MKLNEAGRLKAAGYLPPQGVSFRCGTCSYLGKRDESPYCFQGNVLAPVSPKGCCNYWKHHSVSNPGSTVSPSLRE